MINNIEKKENKVHECTSCQMCSAVCPLNAINIILDHEGFYKPEVDYDLCINCGICLKTCYKYDHNVRMTKDYSKYSTYSAVSKDVDNLKTSTSGGASSILMSSLLEQGYTIVGVTYDYNKDIAINDIVYNLLEIDKFRGSKYMQSYTEETFKKIVMGKGKEKYAIFGTPCHIYALNKWASSKGLIEKFFFVDLFCHGCPSVYLWQKYLSDIKIKTNVDKFEKIEFRSKEYGWHEFSNSFYKEDKRYVSEKTINDPFFTIFFDNHLLGRACYDCKLKSTLEYTDIRLGDYWGEKFDLDVKGVSAIVACTNKGKDMIEIIKNEMVIEDTELSDIIKAQSYGVNYTYNINIRQNTLVALQSDQNMKDILKNYKKMYPVKKKIIVIIKRISYLLPTLIRNRVRKIYHKKTS